MLRCKTRDGGEGVLEELLVFVLVHDLVRGVMLEAARRQGVTPDRTSFIDALDVLRHAATLATPPPLKVNPVRPGRDEPRRIKRRRDRYPYLTRPRDQLRRELGITQIAA